MKSVRHLFFLGLLISASHTLFAQDPVIDITNYNTPLDYQNKQVILIHAGDNPDFVHPDFDDNDWTVCSLPSNARKVLTNWIDIGWYRIHIRMPNQLPDRDIAIALGKIISVDETYFNGVLIGSNGTFTQPMIQAYTIKRVYRIPRSLIRPGQDNVIAVRIGGTYDGKSGSTEGMYSIRYFEDFLVNHYRRNMLLLALVIANIVIGLYFVLFFIRSPHEKDYLAFGSFILILAMYTFFRTDMKYAVPLNFNILKKIEYLLLFPIGAVFTAYINTYLHRKHNLFHFIFYGVTVFCMLFVLFTSDFQWWSNINKNLYQYVLIFAILDVFYILFKNFKKNDDVKKMIYAFLVLFVTVALDILESRGLIKTPLLMPYGTFIIIIANAMILAGRFKTYSENLEILVDERTREVKDRTLQLDQANKKLLKLDEVKNEFIANISHDFRSPLTVILNISDLALKQEYHNEVTRKDFEVIHKASFRLKNAIDKLLDIAKMDAQGVKLHISNIPLNAFLGDILEFYRGSLFSSGVRILSNFPDHDPEDFYSDAEKLEEIMDNILSNAIKFVDPQTGVITVELLDHDQSVKIIIQDNGIGISPDKLESIFNRFEQAQSAKDSIYKGTGIGLAFSKQLVNHLKGKIYAQSEGEGQGSSFIIELQKGKEMFHPDDFHAPVSAKQKSNNYRNILENDMEDRLAKKGVSSFIKDLNQDGEYTHIKALILIIDDDPNIRNIVMKYLQKQGFINFVMANDGKEGLEAVYNYNPDLIISDINMPNMRGDQFQDELLSNPSYHQIPIVFLSAVADHKIKTERREKGASAYLQKPIDEKELIITVNQFLKNYFKYLKVFNLATVDQLSRLNNKRELMNRFTRELSTRVFRNLSLILFDIDNFKDINDEYGHHCGDLVIEYIGRQISKKLRKHDISGRYGGDEFLIILPNTDLKQAMIAADELRIMIAEGYIEFEGNKINVSISSGLASLIDHAPYIEDKLQIDSIKNIFEMEENSAVDWDNVNSVKHQIQALLFNMADEAMYSAKRPLCNNCRFSIPEKKGVKTETCPRCGSTDIKEGRNRVESFNPLE